MNSSRTRWPGALGAIIDTSTSGGRVDLAEMNVESVREHQRLAGGQVRLDVAVVEIALDVIGDQDHDHVGGFGGFGGGQDAQPGGFRLRFALAAFVQADHDVDAGIAQIQRVRVTLAAVADNRDRLAFEQRQVAVFFVETLCSGLA